MGPTDTMSTMSSNSNAESSSLLVPKLCDDRSNWADYELRLRKAMGSRGLWRHMDGVAVALKLYIIGIPVLSNGKTVATDEQLEAKENKIIEFKKREYLAQHIILSTTSVHLGGKIKQLDMAQAMWKIVKANVTTKSTLYLLDAEDQLSTMKLNENEDPKTHLTELKAHFQLMVQRRNNLIQMYSTISDTQFNTIIMSSLLESYQPSLQMITAAERVNKLSRGQSSGMKANNLMGFLIEEAQHQLINKQCGKNAELALAAYSKSSGKGKSENKKKSEKTKSDEECGNCQ